MIAKGGLFSNFENLKNLTVKRCNFVGSTDFNILHPSLSNLTLEDGCGNVNVVTPQLKNLTIRNWLLMPLISAPCIASLQYKGRYFPLQFSSVLLHMEKVNICIFSPSSYRAKEDANNIVRLLQQLHSVKFLTLNLEIIKLLSSFVELISHQPSPFANLKCVKIYPFDVDPKKETQPIATMSTEVKSFLLDGSPGATFTMVSHEEIRAVMNVTLTRNLMVELHVLLDQWKGSSVNKATVESHVTTMLEKVEDENHRTQANTIMKSHFGKRTAHICKQFKKGYKNTDRAISMLLQIEGVLTKLPTSDQAKLQARFSSLCAEVDTIMDIMVDDLKIQRNKKPRLYF